MNYNVRLIDDPGVVTKPNILLFGFEQIRKSPAT
ncbi:hypothetical protein SAMN05216490_4717 [Mucilaginibacter mallensis]|uniref:Uncharacterized protein n=1 Tax=Mucilaginibacter mallensis TaxID=652787 RepID=A0A1H2C7W1_MUCMA|nr:hypothetical protein SAMN05216490_4717 [Mucilaginibacter mallensis]